MRMRGQISLCMCRCTTTTQRKHNISARIVPSLPRGPRAGREVARPRARIPARPEAGRASLRARPVRHPASRCRFRLYLQIELWKSTVWMMSSATDHAFWSIKMRVLETAAGCTLERTSVAGSLRKPLDKSCRCAQMRWA